MDDQTLLENSLTTLAYILPLSLVAMHLGRNGWKLGMKPLYMTFKEK